jgi:ribosomal protein S6--L-glutamate ligase
LTEPNVDLDRPTALRVGVVGLAESWSSEALADALAKRTGWRRVIELDAVVGDLARGRVLHDGLDLCSLDALVVKKVGSAYGPEMLDRLELLRFVEARGVPIFSSPDRILRMVNRVACTATLAAAGFPMPPTILTEDPERAIEAIRSFGAAVLKPIYSTKARGFRLLSGDRPSAELDRELQAHVRSTGHPLFYLQRKMDLSGRDLGVVFLDGEYLGTYARVAGEGAWDTTIHSGGRYERFEPAPEIVEMARRAADLFGLTLAGVDVALTSSGPVIFEVSAFGGFRGLRDGLDLDAAALLADHVVARLAATSRRSDPVEAQETA